MAKTPILSEQTCNPKVVYVWLNCTSQRHGWQIQECIHVTYKAYFSFIKFSAEPESTVIQSCNHQLSVKYGFMCVPRSLEKERCNGFAVFFFLWVWERGSGFFLWLNLVVGDFWHWC